MFKRGSRILSLAIILTIVLTSLCAGITVNAATFAQASDSAYSWLINQQNSTGTGLVDSFEGDNQLVCYTYDQAVAAIAFTLKNDQARAKQVLDKLKALQYNNGAGNGSFYTAYYGNGAVQETNQHVGPVVWVAMAVMAYQKKYNDTYYQGMATWALDWSLSYQDTNPSSPTYGGIKGGVGQNYYSTEHNEDAYRVLKYFSTVNGAYSTKADLVKNFLITKAWEPSTNHFAGALLPGGAKDGNYPLDVNPWGIQSLGLVDGTNNFRNSLNYIETSGLYVTTAGATTAYDFNPDHNDLWFEGTAFMSVAYAMDGNTTKADSIISNIMTRQAANGGVPYSLYGTNNGFWNMSPFNCISSTGWLIIAIAKYNPFTCEYVTPGTPTPTPTGIVPTPTPAPGAITITKLTGGSVKFSITVPEQKASVLVFAKKNGFQDFAPADIVGSGVNNGNGTYTYSITRTGAYVTGDVIVARFYTYSVASGQKFYPGPTDATWSPSVTY